MIESNLNNYNGMAASASGINAGRMIQSASAQNLANANTENYQAVRVELSQAEHGGVNAEFSTPEPAVYDPSSQNTSGLNVNNNVSMIDEIVNLKISENLVDANVAAFKAQDKSLGTIIDIAK